jgi:hypothetical protein
MDSDELNPMKKELADDVKNKDPAIVTMDMAAQMV